MIERTIGHYRVLEKIGEGGMGVVYKGEDLRLKRTVALKFLPTHAFDNQNEKARFLREAQAAALLDHPNICPVFEIRGLDDGSGDETFIVMPYVRGQNLMDRVAEGPLDIAEALDITIQVAQGLSRSHAGGIVHRDIKPANIIITEDRVAKIIDFGLAKVRGENTLGPPGMTAGTLAYMSPEQAAGFEVDQRTDIWSLGVVLYELVTGKRPFDEPYNEATAYALMNEQPEPIANLRADVPPQLARIVGKAMEKSPTQRYQRMADMLADLRALERAGDPSRQSVPAIAVADTGPSVAVLPFADISPQKDQGYFCEGISEEILNALTQVEGLRVVSWRSSYQVGGTGYDVQYVGAKLAVRAVLEGSVRQAGRRIRINVQLVNVADRSHLWSQRFDRDVEDVFAVQDEIALAVVATLKVTLVGARETSLGKRRAVNVEAYNNYLKGRYHWNRRVPSALRKAIEHFRETLDIAPDFAPAYAGLADAYSIPAYYGAVEPAKAIPPARAAAIRALEIDDTLAEAHTSLGAMYCAYDYNWEQGGYHLQRSMESNPGYATAFVWNSYFYLLPLGRLEEALVSAQRARELDPLTVSGYCGVGAALFYNKRYREAISEFRRGIDLDPSFPLSYHFLGRALWETGAWDRAIETLEKSRQLYPTNAGFGGYLGYSYAKAGHTSRAEQLLEELIAEATDHYVPSSALAQIHLGLGNSEKALTLLETAYKNERGPHLIWLNVDPIYESVRLDPRFIGILEKMNLKPPEDDHRA